MRRRLTRQIVARTCALLEKLEVPRFVGKLAECASPLGAPPHDVHAAVVVARKPFERFDIRTLRIAISQPSQNPLSQT
jgi:hypothetical protein